MRAIKLKAALLAASILCATNPAHAGFTLVSGGQGPNSNLIAIGSINGSANITSSASTTPIPAGALVFIHLANRAASPSNFNTCTDSSGNSYSTNLVGKAVPSTAQAMQWSWIVAPSIIPAGTTWSCLNAQTVGKGIMVAAWTGSAASPHDAGAAIAAINGASGGVQNIGPTGTLACVGGGSGCELLVVPWTNHNTGTQSLQTAGFVNFGCNTSNFANMCLAYEIVSVTTPQSYTSTNSNTDQWAMAIEPFEASTGAPPPAHPLMQSIP